MIRNQTDLTSSPSLAHGDFEDNPSGSYTSSYQCGHPARDCGRHACWAVCLLDQARGGNRHRRTQSTELSPPCTTTVQESSPDLYRVPCYVREFLTKRFGRGPVNLLASTGLMIRTRLESERPNPGCPVEAPSRGVILLCIPERTVIGGIDGHRAVVAPPMI